MRDAGHGARDTGTPTRAARESIPGAPTLARQPLVRGNDDESGVPRIPDLDRLRAAGLGRRDRRSVRVACQAVVKRHNRPQKAMACPTGWTSPLDHIHMSTNVDVIEAGYPNSSPEDFEAVQTIGREIQGPAICALSRAVPADIEACGKALEQCKRPRIHTGIGASDIHIGGKFQDERYGKTLAEKKRKILEMAVEAVKLARQFADDVEF